MLSAKPLVASLAVALGLAAALAVAAPAAPQPAPYTLHEWGTFTSVSGSDGVLLPGLEVEEESLPRFVHSHAGLDNGFNSKGWQRPLANVTIKMETPVIYFYSDAGFDAHVEVGFHGGSISQWYPERSGGEVPPPIATVGSADSGYSIEGGDIDFAQPYEGSIAWDVEILPPGDYPTSLLFKGGDESLTWVYPRQTDANVLKNADGTHEKYLFYRGLGNFGLPLRITADDEGLTIENTGRYRIPDLAVYRLGWQGGAMGVRHGTYAGLDAGEVGRIELASLKQAGVFDSWPSLDAAWIAPVYDEMVDMLVGAGLYPKEADAMMQTWWRSYFEQPGLRVFWIVPPEFTDEILPLTVEPAPGDRVRVLVGRSEVLTPAVERMMVESLPRDDSEWQGDRFFDAYAARVDALVAP